MQFLLLILVTSTTLFNLADCRINITGNGTITIIYSASASNGSRVDIDPSGKCGTVVFSDGLDHCFDKDCDEIDCVSRVKKFKKNNNENGQINNENGKNIPQKGQNSEQKENDNSENVKYHDENGRPGIYITGNGTKTILDSPSATNGSKVRMFGNKKCDTSVGFDFTDGMEHCFHNCKPVDCTTDERIEIIDNSENVKDYDENGKNIPQNGQNSEEKENDNSENVKDNDENGKNIPQNGQNSEEMENINRNGKPTNVKNKDTITRDQRSKNTIRDHYAVLFVMLLILAALACCRCRRQPPLPSVKDAAVSY